MKKTHLIPGLIVISLIIACTGKPKGKTGESNETQVKYAVGDLIFSDDFDTSLDNYVLEFPDSPNSEIKISNNKLVVDVDGGTTIWLNKKLSGNIQIEYTRKVLVDSGKNDRLSDLNQFWMASDPRNNNLFTRSGNFKEYDSLLLYYFGFGGNYNSTTRFRKYTGDGNRVLICDLAEKDFLLVPNKAYAIKIVVFNRLTEIFIDNQKFVSYQDPAPLKEGYFGFRTTKSRQEIDNLRIHKITGL